MARLYDGAKASRTEGVALALVNPAASGGGVRSLWPRLEPAVRARFPDLTVRLTDGPGTAERIVREWADTHPGGVLLVAGGDGTLHEAVNGLIASESATELGVIPAGSGNDFARNVGIPLDPLEAVRRLHGATVRAIDLGLLSFSAGGQSRRRVFLNSVSLGTSVRANRLARSLQPLGPARLRYTLAGLAAVLSGGISSYRVTREQQVLLDGPALNLTVANGACFGGGMRISPDSSPVDGTLELVILGPMRRLSALRALGRLQRGTHLGMPGISVTPVKQLRLIGAASARRVEADGEELEISGDLNVTILPARLPLRN